MRAGGQDIHATLVLLAPVLLLVRLLILILPSFLLREKFGNRFGFKDEIPRPGGSDRARGGPDEAVLPPG